ncbi:related to 2,4-dihydroxyhept-2-ene-1,7-dioic acid aldolase [Cephalotrichum gorgonifer]|uniref:Related to 2,4-dihydroxyhept-2-ene-1,7-dioic acid aldolase n=1 Tax=Cephalotrichum gorgonifer TaxID=2041049 RepID=A0AAE8N0E0_9PEZI|nr:related to 2,4-dihydroxyhept-2-ene-1,7-dioic acid aldolase [Cephalotrichum gorgonifer]
MGSITNGNAAPAYTVSNPFRDRVLAGQVCPVLSIKLITGNEIAMACKMAGIPAVFIDMEHSTLDLHTVGQLVLACNFVGVSPIVRVPSKSHWHISRALDAGAAAIVIPHVETVAEVRDLVRAAKYAPLGARGCTNSQPVLNFQHVPTLVQNELLNRETMLIPMIETPGAVDLAEEFLAVDGVDGILIGSNDLCTDMGIPGKYDDPRYQDAVTRIVLAGKKAGKPIGIGGIGPRTDLLEKWFSMGATWSLSGQDFGILQSGMKKLGENYRAINERVQQTRNLSAVPASGTM